MTAYVEDPALAAMPDGTLDSVAALLRTAELLIASGSTMLDVTSACAGLLQACIESLPAHVRAEARLQFSKLITDGPAPP